MKSLEEIEMMEIFPDANDWKLCDTANIGCNAFD